MNTILFLDDWLLDSRNNVTRRFIKPVPAAGKFGFEGAEPPALVGYMNVIRDPESGLYRMWYSVNGKQEIAGKNFNTFLCYAESKDGFSWRRPDLGFAKRYGFGPELRNAVGFDQYPLVMYRVTRDPFDPDPSRRYKLVAAAFEGKLPECKIRGLLYVSSDGIDWKIVNGACWYKDKGGSDTDNNIFYNPVAKRYQIICRPSCLDRRVSIVESEDLVHWSDPVVVLAPDSLDEPLLQFYSMVPYWYQDRFIGLMQVQHVSSTEQSGGAKWLGKVDDELVYSLNGTNWNRTHRQALLERPPLGRPGSEEIYTNSMVEEPDGTLRFYSIGYNVEHFSAQPPEPVEIKSEILVHTLRSCGFACLEPVGGYGYFATRFLIPRSPDLRINFLAPNGRVWVQATTSEHKPFPGYSFEESIPLTGDQTDGIPKWTSGKTMQSFVNEGLKLEFKLFQAQVYAIHWNCHYQYGEAIIERI
jgi:hypothetical protein